MADQGENGEKRRINRTLTAKYDMNALRALQKVETVFMQKLAVIYGCDEDELDVEIDLLGVYNDERSTRLQSLTQLLVGAPGDVTEVLNWVMTEMDGIDELPK